MTPESLRERRTQAEAEFNALDSEKRDKQARIVEIENRQYELRGMYSLLDEQIKQVETKAVSPEANVIDVDAAVKESKKK